MDRAEIAVITVTYNASAYIDYVLENVANQTVDCIHIIADGGSKDGTIEKVISFASRHDHVELIRQSDDGIYDAMNKAISQVAGRFSIIALLNADDYYVSDNSLAQMSEALIGGGDDVVFTNVGYVKDAGEKLTRRTRYSESNKLSWWFFLLGGQFPHPGMIAKSSVYERFTYAHELDIAADHMLQVDLWRSHFKTKCISLHTVNQRMGGHSQSGAAAFCRGKYQNYVVARQIFSPLGAGVSMVCNFVRKLIGIR